MRRKGQETMDPSVVNTRVLADRAEEPSRHQTVQEIEAEAEVVPEASAVCHYSWEMGELV
jgi:hypothetical protein